MGEAVTHPTKLRCRGCGWPLARMLPGGAVKPWPGVERVKDDNDKTIALRCWNCDQLRQLVQMESPARTC